jgi:hypothetical protein
MNFAQEAARLSKRASEFGSLTIAKNAVAVDGLLDEIVSFLDAIASNSGTASGYPDSIAQDAPGLDERALFVKFGKRLVAILAKYGHSRRSPLTVEIGDLFTAALSQRPNDTELLRDAHKVIKWATSAKPDIAEIHSLPNVDELDARLRSRLGE